MIELTQGRSVKWQHGGAWYTGYVLRTEESPRVYYLTDIFGEDCHLVRHSNTNRVFIVNASELQDNGFRKEEKRMESEAGKCES